MSNVTQDGKESKRELVAVSPCDLTYRDGEYRIEREYGYYDDKEEWVSDHIDCLVSCPSAYRILSGVRENPQVRFDYDDSSSDQNVPDWVMLDMEILEMVSNNPGISLRDAIVSRVVEYHDPHSPARGLSKCGEGFPYAMHFHDIALHDPGYWRREVMQQLHILECAEKVDVMRAAASLQALALLKPEGGAA